MVLYMDASNPKSYSYSENKLLYSQDFTNANWGKISLTAATTSTVVAPDGSRTASVLTLTAAASDHEITTGAGSASSGTVYTFSVYAKPNGYNYIRLSFGNTAGYGIAFFNVSNGTLGSKTASASPNFFNAAIAPASNGWYRCSVTYTASVSGFVNGDIYITSTDNQYSWTPDGVSGMYLWGALFQASPYLNTYVATTSTVITPSTNWVDLSNNGNTGTLTVSPVYNPSNGSFVFDGTSTYITLGLNSSILSYTNNFTTELWYQSNTTNPQLFYDRYPSGGYAIEGYPGNIWKLTKYSIIDVFQGTVPTDTGWHHVAVSYSNSAGVTLYLDGQVDSISTNTQNLSVASTYATLGKAEYGFLNGSISMIRMYNRVLSISEVNQNFQAHRDRYGV